MKNKLLVSSYRKISSTKKKFLSLLCMALLGVGFFVGIKATSPDMKKTLDKYLDEQQVYDLEIVSTLGLTNDDILELTKIEKIDQVVGNKYIDYLFSNEKSEKVLRIHSLNEMNQVLLKGGKLPKDNHEIVVEQAFLDMYQLKLDDTITINSNQLKENTFTIVGVIESPIYFTSYRGISTIEGREWSYFLYVLEDAFEMDYFTNIYLSVSLAKKELTGSKKYLDLVNDAKREVEKIEKARTTARFDELYQDTIDNLESMGMEVNLDEFPKAIWYTFTRENNQAYTTFIDSTESLTQIGSVFPLIFFVVALLISLISMSRMVEEERSELGTLKGLGFSNIHLYGKNLLYAILATFLGGFIGMIIGFNLIPRVIWNIYTTLFSISSFVCEFNWYYAIVGLAIVIICIPGAAFVTTHKILLEKPSELMRPKTPKIGKKIFLEHFRFWNRLKFSTKISIRNVFRYKKRVIATIIGLTGSTALLLVGFGLKDSVSNVVDYQFSRIFQYDYMLYLKDEAYIDDLFKMLDENKSIKNKVSILYEVLPLYNEQKESLDITLMVKANEDSFNNLIRLNDVHQGKKEIDLPKEGIVLSEKLAHTLKVKVHDQVYFLINDKYEAIEVTSIVENYVKDYAYLSSSSYQQLFDSYKQNVILMKVGDDYNKEFNQKLVDNKLVSNVIEKSITSKLMDDVLSKLDSVVMILIIASSMLAFVILYNLSSINISERKREISTLKVLGFYDEEVDHYITNENYFITFVGILFGLISGLYLCHYVISTCEPQFVMFTREIKWLSYVITAVISVIFTFIVSKITHFNLKKIDMIDSLKSNE